MLNSPQAVLILPRSSVKALPVDRLIFQNFTNSVSVMEDSRSGRRTRRSGWKVLWWGGCTSPFQRFLPIIKKRKQFDYDSSNRIKEFVESILSCLNCAGAFDVWHDREKKSSYPYESGVHWSIAVILLSCHSEAIDASGFKRQYTWCKNLVARQKTSPGGQ